MIEVPDGPIVPVPPQLFPPIVQEPPVEDRPLPPVIPSAPPAITLTPPTVPTFELDDELVSVPHIFLKSLYPSFPIRSMTFHRMRENAEVPSQKLLAHQSSVASRFEFQVKTFNLTKTFIIWPHTLHIVGTATQVHRGCVENGGSTTQTCLRANNNVAAPQDCRICSGQECNSATGLISSIFLTIAAVFVILRMS